MMKQKKYSSLFFIIILLVSNNCIEPIAFPQDTTSENIVIYGQLTDADEPHYVYIQKSSVNQSLPAPIQGATVKLVDDQNNRYPYKEDKPGRYKLTNLNRGTPGATYFIEATINNSIYRSAKERMPLSIGSDSIFYEITKESYMSEDFRGIFHYVKVFCKTSLPDDASFLRWDAEEIYYVEITNFPSPFNPPPPGCFAADRVDPQRITVLDGSKMTGGHIEQFIAQRQIDFTFNNRHYILVRQLSTTQESFTYWSNVKLLLSNRGTSFDIPPAIVRGNIENTTNPSETVLGYFETCRISVSRFFLVPGYIPYYIETYCLYDPTKPLERYPPECLDCSLFPNWPYPRPAWF